MSTAATLWSASLRSARRAWHDDQRARVAAVIVLVFSLVLGGWTVRQLTARVAQWQAAGPDVLEVRLWLVCLGLWAGLSFFAVLATLRLGFAEDRTRLLMTLPLPPAGRSRALYSLILIEGLWNWLVLTAGVLGVGLVATLGRQASGWLALALAGGAAGVWGSMVATLLVVRFVVPHGRRMARVAFAVVLSAGVLLAIARATGLAVDLAAPPAAPSPARASALLLALLVAALGPLAGRVGRLYLAAFGVMEGRAGPRTVITPPGIRAVCRLLARRRTLAGALLVKGLLSRSRSLLNWARLAAILVYLGVFPYVRAAVAVFDIPDRLIVAGYAALLCLVTIIDSAPSPIGGEGNRLMLYLTAPLDLADLLRAKLVLFLGPVLLGGLTISVVLGRWIGLAGGQIGFAAGAVVLMLIGVTALIVWGSAWDEELDLVVEGSTQALLHEELPTTVRRVWLLNLSLLLLAAEWVMVWKLPAVMALPALAVLAGLVLWVMWRFSRAHLRRLLAS